MSGDGPEALDDELGEFTLRELRHDGPLLLYTPSLASVSLESWYAGRSCFLLGSGPSLGRVNLSLLRKRGVATMAMNNAWCVYRPLLWVAMDSPEFFPEAGWRDPGVTKFVPLSSLGKRLKGSKLHVRDMPAVWAFRRRTGFEASEFLHGGSVCWGNAPEETDALGLKGGRSTMLGAIRLLVYLGFSRVYLAGCDFRMRPGEAYAHGQTRTDGQSTLANLSYTAMDQRLAALTPYLELAGVRIVNTTPDSALQAFPYMPFGDAVAEAAAECSRPMTV